MTTWWRGGCGRPRSRRPTRSSRRSSGRNTRTTRRTPRESERSRRSGEFVRQGVKPILEGARAALAGVAVLALLATSGCVVRETRPLPKVNPVQATHEIPADEQLQVCVHPFDPGLPAVADVKTLDKQRISPDIRKAESVYFATLLRSTLDSSGQWGDVWVAPDTVQFVDVVVTG